MEPVVRNPFTLSEKAAEAVVMLQQSIFAFALTKTEWDETHAAKVRAGQRVKGKCGACVCLSECVCELPMSRPFTFWNLARFDACV